MLCRGREVLSRTRDSTCRLGPDGAVIGDDDGRIAMMSGGPIEGFKNGWAVRISFGSHPTKAHYYERDQLSWCDAICGAPSTRPAALRGLGTWEKCKRCEAALSRLTVQS